MTLRRVIALVLGTCLLTIPSVAGADSADLAPVEPVVETPPRFDGGDLGTADADDPAIWANPSDPAKSIVIGTLKDGGLDVYDLEGDLLQHIDAPPAPSEDDAAGRFNNVDIVKDVWFPKSKSPTGRTSVDLAVVTDRGRDQLKIYAIDARRSKPLIDVTVRNAPFVFSANQDEVNEQTTAYGLAVGKIGFVPVAFVNERERAHIAALALIVVGGKVTYKQFTDWRLPTTFDLPNGDQWTPCTDEDGVEPQFEGMVFDPRTFTLYAAQEPVGVWRIQPFRQPELVEPVVEYGVPYDRIGPNEDDEFECEVRFDEDPGFSGDYMSADAEGLTIYPIGRKGGYLLASSQGDSTFHVYDLPSLDYINGFEVVGNNDLGIDGADESDGATVVPGAFGPAFPKGLLVVHDGENEPEVLDDEGETIDQTNFKYVPWESVADPLGLQITRR